MQPPIHDHLQDLVLLLYALVFWLVVGEVVGLLMVRIRGGFKAK
jgi:predicted cobalt transporter CbtA